MKRSFKSDRPLLLLILVVFAALIFYNLDGWLMDDDEGTDFYEVWQFQEGKEPGEDFVAEQQPLFLLAGRTVLDLAGRSPAALRALSATQILLGALALALAVRHLWNDTTAALTLGLLLSSGLIFEQARLFRPDPMMLGWEMAGLAAALLAVGKKRRRWWTVAGVCFGLSILWKPFGVFPVAGLAIYYLDRLRRRPKAWRHIISDGFAFAGPLLIVAGGISLLLYSRLGFYYQEVFRDHAQLGRDSGNLLQPARSLAVFLLLFLTWNNLLTLFLWPLWYLNRGHSQEAPGGGEVVRLLGAQLLSPLIFLLITRPLRVRYFIYLNPTLAVLFAWQLALSFDRFARLRPHLRRYRPLAIVAVISLAAVLARPSLFEGLTRQETGTRDLAAYVAAHTDPNDLVLSDYAGINFFANRDSIREASIIAGGRIEGGIITAEFLIEAIEDHDIEMVLVHVAGGDPIPHQLVRLDDYERFRSYLQGRFVLLTVFNRNGQQIEVYRRR